MTDFEFEEKSVNKWQSKRADAKNRGIEFSLTIQSIKNLLRAKKCFYTGKDITGNVSIDRVDSFKGYVKGNVVACTHEINQIKATFEKHPKVAKMICDKMYNHMKEQK